MSVSSPVHSKKFILRLKTAFMGCAEAHFHFVVAIFGDRIKTSAVGTGPVLSGLHRRQAKDIRMVVRYDDDLDLCDIVFAHVCEPRYSELGAMVAWCGLGFCILHFSKRKV